MFTCNTGWGARLVLRIVGQVLVQVGQRIGVLAEVVVDHPQLIAGRQLPVQTQRKAGIRFRGRGRLILNPV